MASTAVFMPNIYRLAFQVAKVTSPTTLSKSICEREAIACVRRLVESSMGVLLFSLVVVNQRIGESLLV